MPEITELVDTSDLRIHIARNGTVPDHDAGVVLLWVQRAQRASANHAANVAIDLANKLQIPVVALFCLVPDYPSATLRAYHFMAEGLAELETEFSARNVGWSLKVGRHADVIPEAARASGARVLVTDMAPTRDARAWKQAVANAVDVPMVLVDADVVIPTAHFTKLEWAPRTIRPKIHLLLDHYLTEIPNPSAQMPAPVQESQDPFEIVRGLGIDRSVGPSPAFAGGQREARKRLKRFAEYRFETYAVNRNRADLDGTSTLSPYLHFGHISPIEVAIAARDASCGVHDAALDSFLNELIVQRELCINFALHEPAYDHYEGIPDWGRTSLDKHRSDPRPKLYDPEQLELGQTDDPLWNAAQRQMVHEGFMPNRLRMYWAKQLLLWTPSPEHAFEIAKSLNDRYFIDGRDPNGYGGISWSIGGRHDRPFPPNKPILGLVRPMTIRAMQRSFDVDAYIAKIQDRYGSPIPQPVLFRLT